MQQQKDGGCSESQSHINILVAVNLLSLLSSSTNTEERGIVMGLEGRNSGEGFQVMTAGMPCLACWPVQRPDYQSIMHLVSELRCGHTSRYLFLSRFSACGDNIQKEYSNKAE